MRDMWLRVKRLLLCLAIFSGGSLFGQPNSLNVTVVDSLNVSPRHSGSWGYTDSLGRDYALLGSFTGMAVVAISDTGLTQVGFIPGNSSRWREITVIGDYAYVVSEGGGGLQVVDLSGLPGSVSLAATVTSFFDTGHIIGRDVYSDEPFIYVMGADLFSGVTILDVSNPAQPVLAGTFGNNVYVHDAHIRGNRLYAAELGNGMDIVDISDRSTPVFLTKLSYPSQFTHSSWTTEDHRYLFVTDEVDGLIARVWNIEDLNNIEQVAEYSANLASLVHNPYIKGDFAFIAHNTEGLRVVDIADPALPVEVGYYDTWHGASGGFDGLWSAWPYFDSGKIIGGDRTEGLYVWEFNETRAARIYGQVVDAASGDPVSGAQVTLQPAGNVETSDINGHFQMGLLVEDLPYALIAAANGYPAQQPVSLNLTAGDSLVIEIMLDSSATAIGDLPAGLPQTVELAQNYPNPFNPATTIEFYVPAASVVTFDIFDILGRNVKAPYRAPLPAGAHQFTWNATDAAGNPVTSGVYYYQLRVGDVVKTRKMILMR